ncbi:flagellar filament capping protein FliD [Kineococcus sp. DHX-1]|uniref:flagellar filament capping protein FliD n=1 Tax=Kineococcus sp. DHX-1 TaxID=3349638 RepID=UPI0036D24F7C
MFPAFFHVTSIDIRQEHRIMTSVSSSSSAVDGLISGLDTSSIIAKLLSVDAAPQTQLKNNVSAAQTKVNAYQSVNARLSALQTAASALTQPSTWTAAKASSSDTNVTATATASATPGAIAFTVDSLASGKSILSRSFDPSSPDIRAALSIPLDVVASDGTLLGTVNPTSGSLSDVTAAINKVAGLGLTAVAVRISDGNYRLQISSSGTGATKGNFDLVPVVANSDGSLSVRNSDGTTTPNPVVGQKIAGYTTPSGTTSVGGYDLLTKAQDAQISISTLTGSGSIPVTSATNTFNDLMPGVAVTVSGVTPAGGAPARVSVATDASAVVNSVSSLVTAANAALSEIAKQSSSGQVGATGAVSGAGVLNGDSAVRSLKARIISAVTSALGGSVSAAKYGLQSTSDGQLKFDQGVFSAAYAADPKGTQSALAPTSLDSTSTAQGVVERLAAVTKAATDSVTGTLTSAIKGQTSTISDLTKRISDWDVRLQAKQAYYQKYYSQLEIALQKSQSQGNWLSGQLASMNSSNG